MISIKSPTNTDFLFVYSNPKISEAISQISKRQLLLSFNSTEQSGGPSELAKRSLEFKTSLFYKSESQDSQSDKEKLSKKQKQHVEDRGCIQFSGRTLA